MLSPKEIEQMIIEARKRNAPVLRIDKEIPKDPFWRLVFVVLSSRTKDEKTIMATKKLIKRFSSCKNLAVAPIHEIEKCIYGVGFYRVKARRLKKLAKIIEKNGVPTTFDRLVDLPGVGRKTANVFLSTFLGKPAIGVDVHVHRIANRLGLVTTKKLEDTEKELKKIFPKDTWRKINLAFVAFGQTICLPKKPCCDNCFLRKKCRYYKERKIK